MVFTDSNGNPTTPPAKVIETRTRSSGTNNYYQNDLSSDEVIDVTTDVPYVNCSDLTQPGVAPILNYLNSLPYKPFNLNNCAANTYYDVNNISPYYNPDGSVSDDSNTIGPHTLPTIGDELAAHGITWKYYGEGFSEVNSSCLRACFTAQTAIPFSTRSQL